MSTLRRYLGALALAVATSIASAGAAAQAGTPAAEPGSPAVPPALSPVAVQSLVEKLDPEQVAALGRLMELLGESAARADAVEETRRPPLSAMAQAWLDGFLAHLAANLGALPAVVSGIGSDLHRAFLARGGASLLAFLGVVALALLIGIGAELVFKRATATARARIRSASPTSLWETVGTLTKRTVLELGGLAAFGLAAVVACRLLAGDGEDPLLAYGIVLQVILVPRAMAALLRMALAPHRPDLRLVSTDNWTARFLYRSFIAISILMGTAFFLNGVSLRGPAPVGAPLRFWVSLLGTAWVIFVVWRARLGLTSILKGDEKDLTPGLERMAAWWPGVAIAIVGCNWLFLQFVLGAGYEALSPARGAVALLLVIFAPFLDTMVRGVATHAVPPMQGEGPVAEEAHRETRLSYLRIGRVFLLAALVIAIGKLWGISLQNLAGAGFGERIAANGAGFLLIVAFGYLAWEILNLWVNRQLAREMPAGGEAAESEMGGGGGSRLATILPIVHVTLQITIVTLTVLLALSQLGVNITPLLAGAGVFGLAIGFGAQTLVKDIVSGVFFLMDDAFRVGEFIDVGGTAGTVEKISLRSLQLRGVNGPVHIVPYGEMAKLTNLSRDWVIMKLRFTVPFDTDLDKVRKLFKKIGQELEQDPEHGPNFLAPFKSQGAMDVTDVGIVVRGKFTAKPGTQFTIRKEIYSRVQKAFAENGIEFARREVRVQIPESMADSPRGEDRKAAITGAVAQADQAAAEAQAAAATGQAAR